ncbi:hypothetical protein P5V15_002668 [Pogonomyrmex californicus]
MCLLRRSLDMTEQHGHFSKCECMKANISFEIMFYTTNIGFPQEKTFKIILVSGHLKSTRQKKRREKRTLLYANLVPVEGVEVERRKESITDSPPQQIVTINRLSSPMSINGLNTADKPRKGLPSFIWVIGGPGSNKTTLCTQAVRNMSGWLHISIGELLRTMASSNVIVNDAIVSGEMVSHDIVIQLVEQQILLNRDSDGIVIDGYPRDLNQVQEFESKFGQKPPLILLDCSKLQLGRGRLDDSVSAFRKRLELFREISLPMLKTLDSDNRLTIVDGDTDVPSVQQDFATALYQLMHLTRRKEEQSLHNLDSSLINGNSNKIQAPNEYQNEHAILNGEKNFKFKFGQFFMGREVVHNEVLRPCSGREIISLVRTRRTQVDARNLSRSRGTTT